MEAASVPPGPSDESRLQVHDGKVDFILEHDGRLIPVEVKWTERPSTSEAQHLLTFLKEYSSRTRHGFVICRCSSPMQPHHRITALPNALTELV